VRSVSLEDVAAATGGRLEGPAVLKVSGVSVDSRTLRDGDLFVALPGERFDGHSFLADVFRAGARAAVVEEGNPAVAPMLGTDGPPLVVVKDTLRALGDLAAWVRDGLDITAIGITGSTGKTCTKDFLVSALSGKYRVAASPGSYNNEVGAPLTVFSASRRHQVLVAEMGTRHRGDIARLAQIVKPRAGIITNVGVTHLQLFKSEEAIADAKAELARALPADGALFLDSGDRRSAWMARQTKARVVRFGSGPGALYRASRVNLDREGRASFRLSGPGFAVDVSLGTAGKHQVSNALAAAACSHWMGVEPGAIADGLSGAKVTRWRLEVTEAPGGYKVINDAYNSNPLSLTAALETLMTVRPGSRTIAVLGGMAELGPRSREFHRAAGRDCALLGVDILITVGRRARDYAPSACEAGMPRGSAFRCGGVDEALLLLDDILEPGDVILVKASRVEGLERLARELVSRPDSTYERRAAADV
jgi:UDP-N-acetylmuramoyl-tripeptide--D-alanyl-D-alanine ligase